MVAGFKEYWNDAAAAEQWTYVLERFNADGSPDTAFGTAGVLDTGVSGGTGDCPDFRASENGTVPLGDTDFRASENGTVPLAPSEHTSGNLNTLDDLGEDGLAQEHAVSVWDGGGNDNYWTTAENWAGDVSPQPGDDLVFSGTGETTQNDFDAGTAFGSIRFAANGFVLQGNELGTSAIVVDPGVASSLISVQQLDVADQLTIDTSSATSTLTISAGLSGTGTLVKSGSGADAHGSAAWGPIVGEGATIEADLQNGSLILNYAGESSPAASVAAILDAAYDSGPAPLRVRRNPLFGNQRRPRRSGLVRRRLVASGRWPNHLCRRHAGWHRGHQRLEPRTRKLRPDRHDMVPRRFQLRRNGGHLRPELHPGELRPSLGASRQCRSAGVIRWSKAPTIHYTLTLGTVTMFGNRTVASYHIDWGDGDSNDCTLSQLPQNRQVSHVYSAGFENPVAAVAITDDQGVAYPGVAAKTIGVGNLTLHVWNGGGGDGLWSTPNNWTNHAAPRPGDEICFSVTSATTVNDFPDATIFKSIEFAANGVSISGHDLELTDGITVDSGITGLSIAANIALDGAEAFDVGDNALQVLEIDGVLSHARQRSAAFSRQVRAA